LKLKKKPPPKPLPVDLGPYWPMGIEQPKIVTFPPALPSGVLRSLETDDMAARSGSTRLGPAMEKFFKDLESEVTTTIGHAVVEQEKKVTEQLEAMREAVRTGTAKLEVKVAEKIGTVEGARHSQLDDLIAIAAQRLPSLMVGMAGTGKTFAAAQVAEAFGLGFYAMSVGAQTSKSDIIGFVHAGGKYVRTLFREAFEHGGVFLMDEIDAGNANVLIQVNAALSNDYCAFPDMMVRRHDDFVFIGSANTFGQGANRQYVGRNQLDAATLDRFVVLPWLVDAELEQLFAGTSAAGKKWYQSVVKVRSEVEKEGLRVLVTPRATMRGAALIEAGMSVQKAADLALFNLFPADKRDWAKNIAKVA
jgi:SpoVK/Ycf46/Vps4 family AAA+-type ATPase